MNVWCATKLIKKNSEFSSARWILGAKTEHQSKSKLKYQVMQAFSHIVHFLLTVVHEYGFQKAKIIQIIVLT